MWTCIIYLISSAKTNLQFSYFNNFFEIMWIIDTFITIRQSPELEGGPKQEELSW